MPDVSDGTVAVPPPAEVDKMNPAALKVVEQLSAATQFIPSGQHCRGLNAVVDSPESVIVARVPSAAAGKLRVVLATPEALKVTVVAASVPALAARLAVCPLTAVTGEEHGLLLSAQAVTVTGVDMQVILIVGRDNS